MVHILESLARLENKFDSLRLDSSSSRSSDVGLAASRSKTLGTPSSSTPGSRGPMSDLEAQQRFPTEMRQNYVHVTVPHKIVLWPSIYIHLINSGIQATSDLQYVLEEGTPWFIRQELSKHPRPLNSSVCLQTYPMSNLPRDPGVSANAGFPSLSIQSIRDRCDAFFNTFNVLFPLLNRESFMNETVARLLREGYADGDVEAVLALLVFALGQVAIDGIFERPISMIDGQPSGFRGGTADAPPGLAIFNEARRRLGFVSTQTSLENVQILLLEAIYYESSARHVDFWRSTVAASMAVQVLIKCHAVDWSSREGDLLKRAYWVCMLNEDFYHLDLDLPRTGIDALQDEVPLPYFHEANEHSGSVGPLSDESAYFQYHFLAMIALRRLITTINNAIHQSTLEEIQGEYGGPPVKVISELARQLESWRSLLPRPLQWSDNDRFEFPDTNPAGPRRGAGASEPLFVFDQGSISISHRNNLDIVTAQLRTRFYYARFLMYRPFIYKALHFPELMTPEDASHCAMGIRSACLWPISMAPPKNKKRLVPHLFAWTQNFMVVLLLLRMTTENACLKAICDSHINHEDVQRTVTLMSEWIRDVRQLDGIAEWSWRILEPLYSVRNT